MQSIQHPKLSLLSTLVLSTLLTTGCGGGSGSTSPQTLAAPTISSQPLAGQTVAIGKPLTLSVQASGGTNLSYQWQRDGIDIPGATTASYSINTSTLDDYQRQFRVVVKNAAGSTISNPASVTITGIDRYAGQLDQNGTLDGNLSTASFTSPRKMLFDRTGNLLIAEGDRLRKISPQGQVSTVALGTGAYARANAALTIDTANNLYSASGDSIYKITPAGNVTLQAKLQDSSGYNTINGVAIDAAGNLYVSNYYNVRKVSSSGAVSMINGVEPYLLGRYFSGSDGWSGAVNDLQGNAYLNLDRKLVRIGIDGSQTVLAPELGGYSIAIAPDGSIYAAGFTNLGLSRLGRDGKITEIAGSAGYTIKLGELPGNIGVAQGLAVDARGLVYLSVGHAILRVGPPASDSTGTK